VDYEFIDFQEANHNNNVTENTVQLNTHSSTAEKSTVRLKEDLISNDIKEEPFDYEFIEKIQKSLVLQVFYVLPLEIHNQLVLL
jgi:DNA-dependent RNA polymerase auxiliary subunit epsilon